MQCRSNTHLAVKFVNHGGANVIQAYKGKKDKSVPVTGREGP
jgi:hypothetical protein